MLRLVQTGDDLNEGDESLVMWQVILGGIHPYELSQFYSSKRVLGNKNSCIEPAVLGILLLRTRSKETVMLINWESIPEGCLVIPTMRSMAGRLAAATSWAGPRRASVSPPQRAWLCVHCPPPACHEVRRPFPKHPVTVSRGGGRAERN